MCVYSCKFFVCSDINFSLLPVRVYVLTFRLQSQLSEKESDHKEAISSLESKHSVEIQNLKKLLASSEATNTDLQKEVQLYMYVLC